MIALLLTGLLATSPRPDIALQDSMEPPTASRGVAGVCVRWDRGRRSRLAEAVVVQSSGNAELDARITRDAPRLDWSLEEPDYRGQWIGLWMAVGGATSPPETTPLPDCSAQRDQSWVPAPAAPAN